MHRGIVSDRFLSQRLERTEASAGARFIEARARASPDSGACWIDVAGAYAMYDGPQSPVTQTFGLGILEKPGEADLDRIEQFFLDRGAPVRHEVSPLVDESVPAMLAGRGYRPVEFTAVLYLPLDGNVVTAPNPGLRVRQVTPAERELWAITAAAGWEMAPLAMLRVSVACEDLHAYLVELDGRPVAAGALFIHGGVALLAGASTVPEWRRRGAQRALLVRRLNDAAKSGCDLAMICAAPGSTSQNNAERQGFRIAYTRIKWEKGI